MYFLVIVLLAVVVIFGVSSGMQSYATAKQAQATIEVAQVAQVSAWGNLITILTLALIIVVAVAVLAAVVWFFYKKNVQRSGAGTRAPAYIPGPQGQQSQLTVQDLLQLEMLRTLKSMNGTLMLSGGERQEQASPPVDDIYSWLK